MQRNIRDLIGTVAASGSLLTVTASDAAATIAATPAVGPAPLSVTFTGDSGGAAFFGGIQIDFGDGSVEDFCRPGRACRDKSAVHVYSNPGTFSVRLVGHGEGTRLVLATVVVQVG